MGFSKSADAFKSALPAENFDITKRYDIYCWVAREHRLYANVKLVSRKMLDDIKYPTYLEIETSDGTRAIVPTSHIHLICDHGAKPAYAVIKSDDQAPPEKIAD